MPVKVVIGDLFESEAQTLVNTVNTVGVMGKGVALGFKRRFPDMFAEYVELCRRGQVKLGRPYLYRRLMPPWVLNFPTKDHWRSPSRLADIEDGLRYLEVHIEEWGITSLAVPPLGCGNGELEWRVVGPRLYEHLDRLGIPVTLYAPFGTPHAELQPEYLRHGPVNADEDAVDRPASRVPAAMVALVAVLARLQRNPHHRPIGQTVFQKLAFFGTEAGLPTGLQYARGPYGPFAKGLKKETSRLLNNSLITHEKRGQMLAVRVGSTFERAQEAYADQLAQWAPLIDHLADLFARMDTRDAEVAATVYFAAKELATERPGKAVREVDVYEAVKEWKRNRQPAFRDTEIAMAIRNLAMLGWLDVKPSSTLPVDDLDLAYGLEVG